MAKITQEQHACVDTECSQPQEIISPKIKDMYPFKCDQCPYVDVDEDSLKFHKIVMHKTKIKVLPMQIYNSIDGSTIKSNK